MSDTLRDSVAQQITPRLSRLPVDARGYPIPWFVAELEDGTRDFRVADGRKRRIAVKLGLCWICGEPLGSFKAFVIGPMCAINRVSADPPMHLECAQFSVAVCPFLTKPKAKRREAGMPDEVNSGGGVAIKRNPGVSLLWVTRSFSIVNDDTGGWILRVGEPTRVESFRPVNLNEAPSTPLTKEMNVITRRTTTLTHKGRYGNALDGVSGISGIPRKGPYRAGFAFVSSSGCPAGMLAGGAK